MISGRFVGVRVQQGGFISKTNFAFRRSDAKTKIYYRWKRAGLSIELSDGCCLAHRPSSINPLAAIPAKPSRVRPAAKIEVAKLPLFAAGPTCAALDIHSAERTIGGAGLMRGAFKATRTLPPRRLRTCNLLDDYQGCDFAILNQKS